MVTIEGLPGKWRQLDESVTLPSRVELTGKHPFQLISYTPQGETEFRMQWTSIEEFARVFKLEVMPR